MQEKITLDLFLECSKRHQYTISQRFQIRSPYANSKKCISVILIIIYKQQLDAEETQNLNNQIQELQSYNQECQGRMNEMRSQIISMEQDYNKEILRIREENSNLKYKLQQKEEYYQSVIVQIKSQYEDEISNQKQTYTEFQSQMNQIKEQNNLLFKQLQDYEAYFNNSQQEDMEQDFLNQMNEIQAQLHQQYQQERQELQEEFENQFQIKDEIIQSLEHSQNQFQNKMNQIYQENLQLQDQVESMRQEQLIYNKILIRYEEEIQQQAYQLQQQVEEYKIIIKNLENQMNFDCSRYSNKKSSFHMDDHSVSPYQKQSYQQMSQKKQQTSYSRNQVCQNVVVQRPHYDNQQNALNQLIKQRNNLYLKQLENNLDTSFTNKKSNSRSSSYTKI